LANATLWYKINVGDTLGGVASGQKINFNQDTIVLESIKFLPWENNIKFMSNPNPDGDRIINVTDNGGKIIILQLKGRIKATETVPVDNLFQFLKIVNIITALPFGRFSFDSPNATKFTLVSDATKGYSVMGAPELDYNVNGKTYRFTLNLGFGGKFL